jgi:hypothetical protein
MMDAQKIKNIISEIKKVEVNPVDVENALSTIDQNLMLENEKKNYVVEIWDKQSPINGVDASKFLARDDVGDGEVYLIKDALTGGTIYFQPHNPDMSGFVKMTIDNVSTIANEHSLKIVTEIIDRKVVEEVFKKLSI